jgi:hypothetical protein
MSSQTSVSSSVATCAAVAELCLVRCMPVFQLFLGSAALTAMCVASEPEKYVTWGDAGVIYPPSSLMQHGLWVTGDVINDPKQGLLFRADKPVEGNATGRLVTLPFPKTYRRRLHPCATALPSGTLSYACMERFCRIPARNSRIAQMLTL